MKIRGFKLHLKPLIKRVSRGLPRRTPTTTSSDQATYSGIHIKNRILGGSYGVTDSLFTWKVLTILT